MATALRRTLAWLQRPWLIVGVALFLRVAWMLAYAPWEDSHTRLIARFQGYYFAYLVALVAGLGLTWRAQRWWAVLFLLTAFYFTLGAGCSGNARFRLQTFAFSLPVIALGLDIAQQKRASREV